MTRISARAIIIMDRHVILIHRKRGGKEYWVTPGGKVEEGETLEQAAKREVQEEIGIDVDVREKIFQLTNHVYNERNEQHFFLCTYRSGDVGSGNDPRMLNSDPSDTSEIVFAERSDVETINIVPPGLKEAILARCDKIPRRGSGGSNRPGPLDSTFRQIVGFRSRGPVCTSRGVTPALQP